MKSRKASTKQLPRKPSPVHKTKDLNTHRKLRIPSFQCRGTASKRLSSPALLTFHPPPLNPPRLIHSLQFPTSLTSKQTLENPPNPLSPSSFCASKTPNFCPKPSHRASRSKPSWEMKVVERMRMKMMKNKVGLGNPCWILSSLIKLDPMNHWFCLRPA